MKKSSFVAMMLGTVSGGVICPWYVYGSFARMERI